MHKSDGHNDLHGCAEHPPGNFSLAPKWRIRPDLLPCHHNACAPSFDGRRSPLSRCCSSQRPAAATAGIASHTGASRLCPAPSGSTACPRRRPSDATAAAFRTSTPPACRTCISPRVSRARRTDCGRWTCSDEMRPESSRSSSAPWRSIATPNTGGSVFRLVCERALATLDAAPRAALDRYCDGVNAYVAMHRDELPVEFTLLRYEPRPWTPVDSLVIGKLMAETLGSTYERDLMRASFSDLDPGSTQTSLSAIHATTCRSSEPIRRRQPAQVSSEASGTSSSAFPTSPNRPATRFSPARTTGSWRAAGPNRESRSLRTTRTLPWRFHRSGTQRT